MYTYSDSSCKCLQEGAILRIDKFKKFWVPPSSLDGAFVYLFQGRIYLVFSRNYDSTFHGIRDFSIPYTFQWNVNVGCGESCEPHATLQVRNSSEFPRQSLGNHSNFRVLKISKWILTFTTIYHNSRKVYKFYWN